MADRPLSLTPALVRAVMSGAKTETRRPIVPGPGQRGWLTLEALRAMRSPVMVGGGAQFGHPISGPGTWIRAPWQPGDRLWVRERLKVLALGPARWVPLAPGEALVRYEADGVDAPWLVVPWPDRLKPVLPGHCIPNGCHREAARTFLRVVDVRAERVQEITEAGAKAEGVEPYGTMVAFGPSRWAFADLWDSIYHKTHPWAENPWVWVCCFEKESGS